MQNIKLTVEYDGRNFSGWQIQKKGERTIQGEITRALARITRKPVIVIGAGRTDRGVHALGQIAHVKLDSLLSSTTLLKALNANLPDDIAILKVQKVSDQFHAQYNAKTKIYRYVILNRQARSAKERGFYCHIPRPLNVPLIKNESKALIGRHDFAAFAAVDVWSKKHHVEKRDRKSVV